MPDPTVRPKAVSHIAVRVTDVPRAIAFYRDAFGYDVFMDGVTPTPDRTRSAMGLIGGMTLELLQIAGEPVAQGPNTLGPVGLSLTVDDVEASLAALRAAGVRAIEHTIPAGDWRIAFVFDPDGNVIELVQQPHGALTIADLAPRLRAEMA